VSKADYGYPDDEFDVSSGHDVPRGVHREPRSGWSRWWPFVAVIVLAPLLAYGAVALVTHDRGSSGGGQAAVDDGTDSGDGSTGAATTPAPGSTSTSGATSPTNVPTTPASSGSVQSATPVSILNAAKIQGLAARAQTTLKGAGFSAVTTGNSTGTAPKSSTVYYAKPELQATAEKVAQALKVSTVTLDPAKAGQGVTVVLASDPGF
jgi:hypothetical protein